MAASTPQVISFSSLPTSSSVSSSISTFSVADPVLDIYDRLWFQTSVLPSVSIPCLPITSCPSAASPPPDTSTLLAECMYDCNPSRLPETANTDTEAHPFGCPPWYISSTSADEDHCADRFSVYARGRYYGSFSSLADSYEGGTHFERFSHTGACEDDEGYYYYTAESEVEGNEEGNCNLHLDASDHEDNEEGTCNSHLLASDHEDNAQSLDLQHSSREDCYLEDALSGIYDVASLLKHQHHEELAEQETTLPPSKVALSQVSGFSSVKEQADMKEMLKLWAHEVACALPWKAAAQARPLL
ncbi:hypothetical protein KP509_18G078500 [Ceratopteris richardii]|uniref:Uncharacterized protein n=1 Tax=Ceratopteris richardii TaxID=49495 RepID=A0A8T2SRX2_CERRI|nr:hypothetical protein KP509_18G078500 [Ceratopteris richardii]